MVRRILHSLLTLAVFAGLGLAFYVVGHDGRLPWQPPPTHGDDWCATHQVPLSQDEVCNPKLARGGTLVAREREPKEGECPNTLVRITLPAEVTKSAGIELRTVESTAVAESLKAPAETAYPPSAYARVAPRTEGIVREVRAALGQEVAAGDVLAEVESQELGRAAADYRQALALLGVREKKHAQEKELHDLKVSSGRELLDAASALEEARLAVAAAKQELAILGVGDDEIAKVASGGASVTRLALRAPFAGVVLEASAVLGETAGPEKPLFAVADVARMWVHVDVHEADLPKVEKDQRVVFTVAGLPGKRFVGKVVAISGDVDERSRTIRVVADVKNLQGLLRAHMFGQAEIQVKPAEQKIVVPREAVQTDGDCWFVFTSAVPNVFRTRQVELGTAYAQGYEITGGLALGERVVTTGSFVLKAEVLRGEMGAG
jgi:membrane fusion protein, heavy metal efflux system